MSELGATLKVVRNDEISPQQIRALNPEKIVVSPGPCTPNEAGISVDVIKEFHSSIPILGVCLGHQAIGEAFGGKIIKANKPMHGKISIIDHDSNFLFKNVDNNLAVTRYHSLIIDKKTLNKDFDITCQTKDGVIMGIKHKTLKIEGVQFHPESILTTEGKRLMKNILDSIF